jgi:hypothetical protein
MQFSDNNLLPSSGFIRSMHRAPCAVFDSSLLIRVARSSAVTSTHSAMGAALAH